jgi:hypothetical protein
MAPDRAVQQQQQLGTVSSSQQLGNLNLGPLRKYALPLFLDLPACNAEAREMLWNLSAPKIYLGALYI